MLYDSIEFLMTMLDMDVIEVISCFKICILAPWLVIWVYWVSGSHIGYLVVDWV